MTNKAAYLRIDSPEPDLRAVPQSLITSGTILV